MVWGQQCLTDEIDKASDRQTFVHTDRQTDRQGFLLVVVLHLEGWGESHSAPNPTMSLSAEGWAGKGCDHVENAEEGDSIPGVTLSRKSKELAKEAEERVPILFLGGECRCPLDKSGKAARTPWLGVPGPPLESGVIWFKAGAFLTPVSLSHAREMITSAVLDLQSIGG